MCQYGVFCGPYFPVFGLNTKIYFGNLRIQSEYRKIQTRKNSVFGYFSRSDLALLMMQLEGGLKNVLKQGKEYHPDV